MGATTTKAPNQVDTKEGVSRPRISGQGTPIMVWDNEFEKSIDLRELIGMEGKDFELNPIRKL